MGVEPFLLSSSLIGVVAQRLIRVLHPESRVAAVADEYECGLLKVDPSAPPTIYRPRDGIDSFVGRTGIYECVGVDDEMRRMIHDGAGEHELEAHARKRTPSISDDGMRRVLKGETSIEEVLRVTRSD
jgi:general secretion pathway protein E